MRARLSRRTRTPGIAAALCLVGTLAAAVEVAADADGSKEAVVRERLDAAGIQYWSWSDARRDHVTVMLRRGRLTDLTPFAGVPIDALIILDNPVADLSPLQGMTFRLFMIKRGDLRDLSPLRDIGVTNLALDGNPLEDIAPLRSVRGLRYLDLRNTHVADLSPLAETELRRLDIGDTPVRDLSPLAALPLEHLAFSPQRITNGMEAVFQSESLASVEAVGDVFSRTLTPAQFRRWYERGMPWK